MRLTAFATLGLVLAAPTPVAAQDYYSDVRPLMEEKCLGCHNSDGIGFSMENPERAYRRRQDIAEKVTEGVMPPWLAEAGHQQYVGDRSLSSEQIAMVATWARNGYEKGEPRVRSTPRPGRPGFVADVSIPLLPGGSYLPDQTSPDEYRCFVVDWPVDEATYVTGFRASPGNLEVAHHVVVYAVEPAMADRFRALPAEDGKEGYTCFGGALPDRLGSRAARAEYERGHPNGLRELNSGNWWLAHWAPGMDGYTFPEGTGIWVQPGSVLVVQMHYYSAHAGGARDADTRMDFKLAADVDRPAFHYPLTRNRWLAGERTGSMTVPVGEKATYEVSTTLGQLLPYVESVTRVPQDSIRALYVHSANLHMHAYGHSGVITLTNGDGRKETLLSVPRWDLAWQQDFTFLEPKSFARDELDSIRLTVQCTFENTSDHVVYGGYGSDDEMCFDFSYIAVEKGVPVAAAGGGR